MMVSCRLSDSWSVHFTFAILCAKFEKKALYLRVYKIEAVQPGRKLYRQEEGAKGSFEGLFRHAG
jgi:hypothetical protein